MHNNFEKQDSNHSDAMCLKLLLITSLGYKILCLCDEDSNPSDLGRRVKGIQESQALARGEKEVI